MFHFCLPSNRIQSRIIISMEHLLVQIIQGLIKQDWSSGGKPLYMPYNAYSRTFLTIQKKNKCNLGIGRFINLILIFFHNMLIDLFVYYLFVWLSLLPILTNTCMETSVAVLAADGKKNTKQQRPLWSENSDRWQWSEDGARFRSRSLSCRHSLPDNRYTNPPGKIRWRPSAVVRLLP